MSVVDDRHAAADAPAPNTTSERVLIVEDDPAARVGLEQLIKSWGFLT